MRNDSPADGFGGGGGGCALLNWALPAPPAPASLLGVTVTVPVQLGEHGTVSDALAAVVVTGSTPGVLTV